MNEIREFQGEFRFLSNFFPSPMLVRGVGTKTQQWIPTAEHLFQALKTRIPEEQQAVLNCATPGQAKRLGRQITLRDDWEDIKLNVMRVVIKAKFEQNPRLAQQLLATGEAQLIEGNWWNDKWFGVCLRTGEGENHLGKILMETRQELQL